MTLDGKVLCGYQGWFNTPCDSEPFDFGHWGRGLGETNGRFVVDMWPDVSEYDPEDLCAVPGLKMPDGSPARLYSAYRKGPVLLHCKWMRQYGIDGVFVSRFVGETTDPARFRHINTVLANIREGCHREGRVWAMMLDLIGGIDPAWRTLGGSSRTDPAWPKVYRMFDSISPWDAGRYRDNAGMDRVRTNVWEGDLAELKGLGIGYMPTAFPGFSWDNLRQKPPGTTTIARRKGEFYWRQFAIFKELGIRSVFVGMFDEVNEGTAIYKVANQTPVGRNFVNLEGLPTDWYLRLTGAATRMIRDQAPPSASVPDQIPLQGKWQP
jgi:hypothetical protein